MSTTPLTKQWATVALVLVVAVAVVLGCFWLLPPEYASGALLVGFVLASNGLRNYVHHTSTEPQPRPSSADRDWEEWWRAALAGRGWQHDRVRLPLSPFLHLVDWLDRPQWRRVLIVGCGISTEPALLAWLGYEVVAIDISRIAIDHLQARPATVQELAAWLKIRRDSRTNENRAYEDAEILSLLGPTPKGSVELICIDFREYVPSAPFDVVYSPWSWQCLDVDARRELARRAFAWTAPGGACRVATQNLPANARDELDRVFQEAGFFARDELADAYRRQRQGGSDWSSERHDQLSTEDQQRALGRLDEGERMYDVWNASG